MAYNEYTADSMNKSDAIDRKFYMRFAIGWGGRKIANEFGVSTWRIRQRIDRYSARHHLPRLYQCMITDDGRAAINMHFGFNIWQGNYIEEYNQGQHSRPEEVLKWF